MMYPFMTLDDDTEITHSEMRPDGTVKVYIEKPDEKDCFHHAACTLPGYAWSDVYGFSREEIERQIQHLEPVFYEMIPLSLEEIFISETEVAGYDIKKLIL